jgi:carboxyl-terminal processing protease
VTGGSTQLEGVKSDVIMPDRYSYIDMGEREFDNPLPYDKIESAQFEEWDGYIDYDETIKKSRQRMENNDQIRLIEENAHWIKKSQEDVEISLNYEKYSEDIDQRHADTKKFDAIDEYDNKLSYESLPYEIQLMQQDTTLREKRKRWHKNLSGDIYVEEAINVLEDLKMSNIRKTKLAEIKN